MVIKRWMAVAVLFTSSWFTVLPAQAAQQASDEAPEVSAVPSPSLPTPALAPDQELVPASQPETPQPDHFSQEYAKGFLSDFGRIINSPLHWDKSDWLKVGIVGGVTSGLFLLDRNIKDFSQSHKSSVANRFAAVGNDMGLAQYALPSLGAFYLYGSLKDDAKARQTSLLALESYGITAIMTEGLKVLVQRHRPNTGDAPGTLDGPKLRLKNLSFISGHTSSVFSLASVFAEQYKDKAWVPPVAYGLAGLTGLSRIYSNAHWSSDAFVGAALGYFVGKSIVSYHKSTPGGNKLTIMPSVSKELTGVSMSYNF